MPKIIWIFFIYLLICHYYYICINIKLSLLAGKVKKKNFFFSLSQPTLINFGTHVNSFCHVIVIASYDTSINFSYFVPVLVKVQEEEKKSIPILHQCLNTKYIYNSLWIVSRGGSSFKERRGGTKH